MITALQAASDRQHEAVSPSVSAWVSASAGSGKTKVLIDRLLALLLQPGMRPSRLLCLTFTKAAAAEMANRLTQHLADWATMPDNDLIKAIDTLTGAEPDEPTLRRARALFAATLDAPGGLAIMTIHAFCQSVIQRFPLEAGVAPNFAILEDAETAAMLLDARNAVLTEAQSGATPDAEALSQAFLRLSNHAGETRFGDIMRAVCGQRSRLKRLLGPDGAIAPAIAALSRCLGVAVTITENAVVEAAIDAVRDHEAEFLEAASALARGTKTDQETAAKLRAFFAGQLEFDDFQLIFISKTDQEIRKKLVNKGVAEARPDVADFMDKAALTQMEVLERRKSARLFELSAAALTLGAAILKRYETSKQARLRLDYDDLILKTKDLLGRDGGVSWAMFKLDEGVDHILIDEAQDTNPDQWDVVTALTEEFFAGSERQRTLMVVGDAKQSIYSFQGADPRTFAALREKFSRRAALGEQPWRDVLLTHSFRSTSAVLEAVDAVFAVAESRPGVVDPGDDLLHQAIREGHAGLVELWPPAEPPESPEEDAWSPPEATADQISARDRIGLLVARKIKDMIDRQDRLASLDRPVRPGDFLVLVRSRGGFVVTFLRELKRLGVPVAGADRLALTSHIAVQDLMALGRFLLLPEDDLNLAALLKSPLIGCDDDRLMALAPGRPGTLWDSLSQRAEEDISWRPIHDQLAGLLRRVDFQPPYELFARVLADGGRRRLRARLGEECDEPLDEFLAACLRFEALGAPSLQGFLLWLERAAPEVKREADAGRRDEVRVMTVHGAKGLEAPIVILPDCFYDPTQKLPLLSQKNDPLSGNPVPLWSPNQKADDATASALRDDARRAAIEEHRRLLYVALTRARDRLYVTGWKSQRPSPHCWWDAVRRGLAARAKIVTFDFNAQGFAGWVGEGLRLENPQLAKPEAERRPKTAAAEAATPPNWTHRMMPEESRPPRVLSPSRMAELPALRSPLTATAGGGFKRGLLIHRLLQSLPDLKSADRAAAALRFLSQKAHALDPQDVTDIARETLSVLEHPAFAAVFGPGSRAEVPVTGRLAERLVAGQIDRLVALPDRVLIVDFKTNRPPPADLASVDPSYLLQLALYRGLVATLYPDRPVEAALLWTDIAKLMPIPGDLLDATLARMVG